MDNMPNVIGQYQIKAGIRETLLSTVLRGYDPKKKRDVVIKILKQGSIKRFLEEIAILSRINHPNVVKIFDQGIYDGKPYYVMPFMKGGSLDSKIEKGPMSPETALNYMSVIARTLDKINDNNIIHRDIKPANILFDEYDNPFIADFGIAKLYYSNLKDTTSTILGSPHYISPEQANGMKNLDRRTDVYSLGAVLFQMLTGRPPYDAENPLALALKHVQDPIPKLKDYQPGLPSSLQMIIDKALAKDRQNRYSTATELLIEFERAIGTQPIPPIGPPPVSKRIPSWMFIIGGFFVLFLFVLVVFISVLDAEPNATNTPVVITVPRTFVSQNTELPGSPIPISSPTIPPIPTLTLQPPLGVGSTKISPIDGMEMVYIPEGSFVMGEPTSNRFANPNEKPQREIALGPYWIDKTEVTNGMYEKCVRAGKCTPPNKSGSFTRDSYFGNNDYSDFPVIRVEWDQAKTYCTWANKRLPTEAEWEKAARGTDGRKFPWGNPESASTSSIEYVCKFANYWEYERLKGGVIKHIGCMPDTLRVGSYPQGVSPYGALDMLGNVGEWVADWYDNQYYQHVDNANPLVTAGKKKVLRGAFGFETAEEKTKEDIGGGGDGGSGGLGFSSFGSSGSGPLSGGGGQSSIVSITFVFRLTYRYQVGIGYFDYTVGFRCASNP